MIAPSYWFGDIFSLIMAFMISIVFALFNPLGLGFIVFSFVRGLSKSDTWKKTSFILQIIFCILTFVLGLFFAFLMLFGSSIGIYYSQGLGMFFAVLFGVGFVVALQIGVIIWQSFSKK